MRKLACFLLICTVAGCTIPRGAALESEILNEANETEPSFAVEQVTRANLSKYASWPPTGWHGHHYWLSQTRGSSGQIIENGDTINLRIWDNQANSLLAPAAQKNVDIPSLRVSPSGSIFVPYVEEVVVRGLSEDEARAYIQQQLAPIAPSAQVILELVPGQGNSVDLVSGVANPGSYPLPSKNYSILSLIAEAGGIRDGLRNPVVRLIRGGKTYEIFAGKLFERAAYDIVLRGGDKIIVDEDKRYFTALGATGTETIVDFDKERITALEALSMLGGISDTRANPKGVLILREYPASAVKPEGRGPSHPQVVFSLDLTSADGLFAARNFQVHAGDTVLATESPITAVGTILGLLGSAVGASASVSNLQE